VYAFAEFKGLLIVVLDLNAIVGDVFVSKSIKYIDFDLAFGFPELLLQAVCNFRLPLPIYTIREACEKQEKERDPTIHRMRERRGFSAKLTLILLKKNIVERMVVLARKQTIAKGFPPSGRDALSSCNSNKTRIWAPLYNLPSTSL
jgi:hypothetical protein